MLLKIFIKGYLGIRLLLTLKMGHKRRKVENHWSKSCNILKWRKIKNPNPSTYSSLVIFMYWACERQEVYFLCCDQKFWAASAQSFTLWQQATIEITQRDHSIIACSRHIYLCVALRAHPVRGESHFQCNANWELAITSLLFAMNSIYRTFFLWRLHLAPPSHPGHSTSLLWLEKPSSECAKLHTVEASNNRDHTSYYSISACSNHIYYGCCSSRTSRSWWIAHST